MYMGTLQTTNCFKLTGLIHSYVVVKKPPQIERKVCGLTHQLTNIMAVLQGIMFAYQDMFKQVYGSFVQYMFQTD